MRIAGAVLVVLAAVLATFHPLLGLGFVGPDTYPLLLECTVDSPAAFLGLFTDELLAGRFSEDFYRPGLNLSVALDRALWGTAPLGYQVTTLLVLAGTALALFAFTARLAGPRARLAPWIASLVFVLQPVQYELLPALARRADVLSAGLVLAALALARTPRPGPRASAGVFALALAAVATKETAVLVLPAAVLLALLFPAAPGSRWRGALRAGLAPGLAVLVATGARLAVLGSLGGDGSAGPRMWRNARWLARLVVHPQREMRDVPLATWLPALLVALLVVVAWSTRGRGVRERAGRALAFAAGWIVLAVLLHAYAGKRHPWYAFYPAVGWSLFAGVAADALVATLREGPGRLARASAACAAALLAVLLAWQARYSVAFTPYAEWRLGSDAVEAYFADARARVEAAPPGSVVRTGPFPRASLVTADDTPQGGARIRSAFLLDTYSLDAWAELVLDAPVRVVVGAGATAGPDERVLLVPGGRPVRG